VQSTLLKFIDKKRKQTRAAEKQSNLTQKVTCLKLETLVQNWH